MKNKFFKGVVAVLFVLGFGFGSWYAVRNVQTGYPVLNNVIFPVMGMLIGMYVYSSVFRGNK
jgi:hypothetical protein